VEGSPNVFIGGSPVLRVGDHFADGSAILAGAAHVKINGKPAARLGDAVTGGAALAQGCPRVKIGDGGGAGAVMGMTAPDPESGKVTAFAALRRVLESRATDKDKLLLCIPDIALVMAEKENDENERQGWLYLRSMMMKWLMGMVNRDAKQDNAPFWIDWDWVMGLKASTPLRWGQTPLGKVPYPGLLSASSPKQEYEAFVHPETESFAISNLAALISLGRILKRDGMLRVAVEHFNHISVPWNEWEAKYHSYRRVPQPVGIGGQQAALGSFALRALANGWTEPEGEKHRIHITEMAVFAIDLFNFAADDYEWLAFWSCEEGYVSLTPGFSYSLLHNEDFRGYQDRHDFGRDYLVLSKPHLVENFQEISYVYP
jgi:hypothetical protein